MTHSPVEFKLLGNTEPAAQSLGLMPQGIGFPDHDVEPAVSGWVSIQVQEVLRAQSFVDQDPTGLGVALQLTLGAAQTTTEFDVDALGNVTCLVADEYQIGIKISTGRTGAGGISQIYARLLLNGVQAGNSTHTIVDNDRIEIPATYDVTTNLAVNDVLTFEIIRDTDGTDEGGIRAGIPDVVGWNSSPSIAVVMTRTVALVAS